MKSIQEYLDGLPQEHKDKVKSRLSTMVERMKQQAQIVALSLDAAPWYQLNQIHRPYHNWDHACEVIAAVKEILASSPPNKDKNEDALILAASWHDAVYVPGARNDANEIASGQALRNAAREYDSEIMLAASRASVMIEHTTIAIHMGESNYPMPIDILLDADLSGLASEYEDFCKRQDNIIVENGGNVEMDRPKCAEFLVNFLNKEWIYRTAYGQATWEEKARENIARYCSLYSPSNTGENNGN